MWSRRAFLKTALGTAGLAGLAGVGVSAFVAGDFLRATLHRLLGSFILADTQLTTFCDDFARDYGRRKLYAVVLIERVPVLGAAAGGLLLRRPRAVVEKFERKLLTAFIVSTSYLQVGDPAVEPIEYRGLNIPCTNPFARFDFDDAPDRHSG
ncbi:MAG TPA: hypothetical protein ENK49_06225 [Gammaproteobacteria bacterium]|nr:hypothetical protein [Gammaproteobacteria bacterium]